MFSKKRFACAVMIVAACLAPATAQEIVFPVSLDPVPGPVPNILQRYTPVTAERLKKPEDANWLLFRRTYDGWGYSPLRDITPANVARLAPVWSFSTGQVEGHQAPPIVNNGIMFVATPGNQVLAIEAKSGAVLWRYKRAIPEDMTQLHPTSRGVGLWGDKVFFAATEAVLVALDAKTGKEAWTTKVEDYKKGYYMSLAPLVVDGRVMIGVSGGELACADSWRLMITNPATSCGAPTRCRREQTLGARLGRKAISGRPAEARCGSPAPTIRIPTSPSGEPAMADRGWVTSARATISTLRR